MASYRTNLQIISIILLGVFLSACGGGSDTAVVAPSTPEANNVNITGGNGDNGDALPGDRLSGAYTYSDTDNNSDVSTFRWLRDGTAISDETQDTYTVTYDDKGASISFEVTPVSSAASGTAVSSSSVSARLAIFDTFQNADVVIGQVDFIGNDRNQGIAAGANTLTNSYGNLNVSNGVLYITDTGNERLLGFNAIPTVDNTPADFVLGQADFISTTSGVSPLKFSSPESIAIDNGKMFLNDYNNGRVLIWNNTPTGGGQAADIVLGADDLNTVGFGPCDSQSIYYADGGIWATNGKLILTDTEHNRVLIWNSIPSSNNAAADLVLGQKTFTTCEKNDDDGNGVTDGPSARTAFFPSGVWSDGTRLVVNDGGNNRVLIWNTFPTTNQQPADVVLGQNDFIQNTGNDDDQNSVDDVVSSSRTLKRPTYGLHSNGTQLFVTDLFNHRVLIWNSFPTSDFQAADVVIGQSDFTHNTRNDDNQDGFEDASPTARTLNGPAGVFQSGRYLLVTDTSNQRVLIYYGH